VIVTKEDDEVNVTVTSPSTGVALNVTTLVVNDVLAMMDDGTPDNDSVTRLPISNVTDVATYLAASPPVYDGTLIVAPTVAVALVDTITVMVLGDESLVVNVTDVGLKVTSPTDDWGVTVNDD
jgi:hypothetical protein